MGSMLLRMFFDKRELRRHLLEMDREQEEAERARDPNYTKQNPSGRCQEENGQYGEDA